MLEASCMYFKLTKVSGFLIEGFGIICQFKKQQTNKQTKTKNQ